MARCAAGSLTGLGRSMKFRRLRLTGFKSFVEPAEIVIEAGLTGVVGPNGCGKSNLLEALRWVMGESSYKNMRASGMDDVIFSGTADPPRPQHRRSHADPRQRRSRLAPLGFNDCRRHRGLPPDRARGRARPTASTVARRAPATFSCSLPMPRPAPARRRSWGRARSARSSTRSRRRAAACSKKPPASPGFTPAATRPS